MQKRKGTRAFTIVELLIVVVVIAILAAITLVTYNGIQQRARNAQVVSGVNTYIKVIHEYWTLYSTTPISGRYCLGANYPSEYCWTGDSGMITTSSQLDSRLSEFISTKPVLATKLFSIGLGNNMRAGAIYEYSSGTRIVYYLEGAGQACGIAGATGITEGGVVTQCQYAFPYQ